jgi:gluconolactonase
MWQQSTRYPDPAVQILHPSFAKYRLFHAAVERLASGCRWSEGPVWFGDHRCLLWSDIPNNRILRFDELTGQVSCVPRSSKLSSGSSWHWRAMSSRASWPRRLF